MNVLQFTIPVSTKQNIILKTETGPYFYEHLHRHEEMQLCLIEKGEGTLVINNEMHRFVPGDIFCIGANQPHVFKSDPVYFEQHHPKKVKALNLFFNPQTHLRGLFDLEEMDVVKQLLISFNTGFYIPAADGKFLSTKIKEVFCQQHIDQFLSFIALLNHLTQTGSLKMLSQHDELSAVSENEGIRISQIYHYIMMNYNRQITLEEIAGKANMTPQAFCRFFKKRTMRTFVSFLNEVRVNEACQKLIKDGFESISLVAYNCGFNSVTHFNRIFKTIMNNSPSKYLANYYSNTSHPFFGKKAKIKQEIIN